MKGGGMRARYVAAFLVVLLSVAVTLLALASVAPDEGSRRVRLIARVEPSVVVVLVEKQQVAHRGEVVGVAPSQGLGTGVVLSADGLILTAAHVVGDASRIAVKALGREAAVAKMVFSDAAADIALLRVEKPAAPLPPARLGDSDVVKKGESVFVIGNPVGIEHSVSTGIISGRHAGGHLFGGSVEAEMLQTDAAINPGNSGGPIFNSDGEVIAIAQRIVTEGGGSEGLGFGLAINAVKKLLGLDPCIWLGFSGVPLDEPWSRALNVPVPGGVLVESVTPGGPADQAGLRGGQIAIQAGKAHVLLGGDIILRVDGLPILEWVRSERPAATRPGERHELKLAVLRSGQLADLPLVTVHRPRW